MKDKSIEIRVANANDAKYLLEIYKPYILKTAITFELEVPTVEEFTRRIHQILTKYPYLVAEQDGEIVGYAYAKAFHVRPAFDWCVETSIYIKENSKGCGLGKTLYTSIEKILRKQHVLNMNASIAYPAEGEDEFLTFDSVKFHQKMGFHKIGEFHKCGYKFNRWYDLIWMEKFIGEHPDIPQKVISFNELKDVNGIIKNQ